VPVVVREVTDERMLTIGTKENLQRADLTPLEEAQIVA
jgi:ParB-like chromosome segregation protein Spo0J